MLKALLAIVPVAMLVFAGAAMAGKVLAHAAIRAATTEPG